ncbi:MAG: glycosyltransferase family 2 protein [Planctomycetota bacterium]
MMPLLAAIPLILLVVLAVGCAVYYAVVLQKVALTRRLVPLLSVGLDDSNELVLHQRVAVVIPAHNEEELIAACAQTLACQDFPGELRVIFVLDRCSDHTERVLRETVGDDDRFEIIVNEHCPDGWAGKVHACHVGSVRARELDADYFLFADADCAFEPECIRAAVAMIRRRRVGMLSLLPTLANDRTFERLDQPAAGVELLRQFPLHRVNRRTKPKRFANGQFMLFSAEAYETIGGHEAVKDSILEDLAFARLAVDVVPRVRIGVLMADGLLRCKMYESRAEFQRGWRRIFIEAAYCQPRELRKHAWRLRLSGVVFPIAAPLAFAAGAIVATMGDKPLAYALGIAGGSATFMFFFAMFVIYRFQGVPLLWAPLYPIGAFSVSNILARAARDLATGKPTEWGGISYQRPRDGGRDGRGVDSPAEEL